MFPQNLPDASHLEKKHSFFQIIHKSIIQEGKLAMPKKFFRGLREELSDDAFLKVPTGRIWPIKPRKAGGQVWLNDGLQEFLEFYSVHVGHCLLFRYMGNSLFDVVIFGMDCCEIQYCSNTEEPALDRGNQVLGSRLAEWNQMTEHLSKDNAAEVVSPFSFIDSSFRVFMHRSYVSGKFALNVSFKYMRKHLWENVQDIKLVGPDGRYMTATCHLYEGNMAKCSKLYNGWETFVRQYHLREGDTCVFKVIRTGDVELHVSIFRQGEDVPPVD